MSQSKIFIFRIAKGQDSGQPIGKCTLDYTEIKKIISEIPKEIITPIDYENNGHLGFIQNELRQKSILRQGWGIKNLDLKQPTKEWIEKYMYSGKIYWNADINCNEAKGRWNIINRMLDMKKDDILLIPKTSQQYLNDYNKFSVCKVDKEYYFDYPTEYCDFGHCIKVDNLQDFNYGKNTLDRSDFSSPYLWAITEVKRHHGRYKKFVQFLDSEYSKM